MNTSEALKKARIYEEEFPDNLETKPIFHVTAPVGWINDPNGFSIFKDDYHLFYQYHPYSTHWGPMHWGHCKSKDFIKWEPLPCAIAPDSEFDKNGCFSGTALEHDGKHILMYTGVVDGKQAQCIAVGDGLNYEKEAQNPVIDVQSTDFRDPKIWHDGKSFRVVVVHRGIDGSGELIEYMSKDLKTWELVGVLDRSDNNLGKMWECPDIFYLENKRIIIMSIQENDGIRQDLHPGNANCYFILDENNKRGSEPLAIDDGLDFYAPQTLETLDGRRIMIAWAQNWENYLTPQDFSYSGIMTFPRELSFNGSRLCQMPVRELNAYLKKSLNQNNGRVFDLRIEVETSDWFSVKLASDGKRYTSICYDFLRNKLTIDRTYSGSRKDVLHSRSIHIPNRNGKLTLRILMDKYIMEVFVNDGEQALTSLIYTPLECDGIKYNGNQYHYEAIKYDIVL